MNVRLIVVVSQVKTITGNVPLGVNLKNCCFKTCLMVKAIEEIALRFFFWEPGVNFKVRLHDDLN